MKSVRVRIEGRVQGVWYRGWTMREASRRGLSGWVRNLRDGSVEAVFSGPEDQVEDMLRACHDGPPAAHVLRVSAEPCPPPEGTGFRQEPTR